MVGVKEEFYSSLRDDYIKNGTNSFLYRYIEQEKQKLLSTEEKPAHAGKRSDAYLQIKRLEMDFRVGKLSKMLFLKYLLQFLLKGDKLRLKKETRQFLFDVTLKVENDVFFKDCKKDVDRYKKVIESISGANEKQRKWENNLDEEVLQGIVRELLECAMIVDIQTFLYDVGFPVNADGKLHTSRKKDRNLDMLAAYCRENRISLSNTQVGGGQSLTEVQVHEYTRLFEILQTSDNRDVIIPVLVDALTGAGVYIIGKNNISPKSDVYKKIKGNCCYVCFMIDGLSVEDYKGKNSFSWLINDDENALCDLPDLEEALKWHLYFKSSALEDFQERNGKAPEGCPEEFLSFFEAETKDELYVSEEELEKVKAMFA